MPKNGYNVWGSVSFRQLSPLLVIWDVLGVTKSSNQRVLKCRVILGQLWANFGPSFYPTNPKMPQKCLRTNYGMMLVLQSFSQLSPFTVIWDGLGVIYLPNSRFFLNFGDFELISAYFGPYLEPRNTNMPKNG